ncbi:MAG: hypothetical protein GY696_17445 [Gammaproteobacteria bacterium]|nr:hypothetical protein [Gammaproteobacteria bacterium]
MPDKGTIQLTLFNPLGTVVKMFVVMYDLTDMPPISQTFLRQRTLYIPAEDASGGESDDTAESRKWLRYLIHLRYHYHAGFWAIFIIMICTASCNPFLVANLLYKSKCPSVCPYVNHV